MVLGATGVHGALAVLAAMAGHRRGRECVSMASSVLPERISRAENATQSHAKSVSLTVVTHRGRTCPSQCTCTTITGQ